MKFDDHLAKYLYENKSLKLEGIGTFTLDDEARVPNEQEKEVNYPIEGLAFTYNPKSITDEEIIFFIIKNTGKIEPLIRSDLEYYASNIKMLLNIGHPYTIEGIGTLSRNNQGTYEFTPANFFPAKEELNSKGEISNHNYPARSNFSAARLLVMILIGISAIAVVAGIGWGIFNFTRKQPVVNEARQQQGQIDTIAPEADTLTSANYTENIPSDTENQPRDLTAETIPRDSVSYKMVFEITKSKERALTRTEQLNNLHSYTQYDSIPINDSVAYYRLFLIMKVAAADTTHVKDSLRIFFGSRVFMEKNQDLLDQEKD